MKKYGIFILLLFIQPIIASDNDEENTYREYAFNGQQSNTPPTANQYFQALSNLGNYTQCTLGLASPITIAATFPLTFINTIFNVSGVEIIPAASLKSIQIPVAGWYIVSLTIPYGIIKTGTGTLTGFQGNLLINGESVITFYNTALAIPATNPYIIPPCFITTVIAIPTNAIMTMNIITTTLTGVISINFPTGPNLPQLLIYKIK